MPIPLPIPSSSRDARHLPIHLISSIDYMSQYPYTTLLFPQPSSKIHCKSPFNRSANLTQSIPDTSLKRSIVIVPILLLVHVHTYSQPALSPTPMLCFVVTPPLNAKEKKKRIYSMPNVAPPKPSQSRVVFYGGPPFSIGDQAGYLSTYQQEVELWFRAGKGGNWVVPLRGGAWTDMRCPG
jgi:hypothetical protein